MPGSELIGSNPGAPQGEVDLAQKVVTRVKLWEDGIGREFRAKCERLYDQYRGFKRWESAWIQAGATSRDGYLREARAEWGADLHIPLSYRTIETIVPRAIANAPKLLYIPRAERWQDNVEAVQMLIDAQQEQIDIDLPLQGVMRNGQTYGLGVGKTFWDRQVRMTRTMQRRRVPRPVRLGGSHYLGEPEEEVLFDDPRFESVDLWDFVWDPYGYDMRTCGWTAQKVWLTLDGVVARLPSSGGAWNTDSAALLDEKGVEDLGNMNPKYDEIWRKRMAGSGFNTSNYTAGGAQDGIHELIEYHNGDTVLKVLDRKVLVETGENPCKEMPFQIYRPTPLEHQLVGIGALEPLEHLQRELDTLRSQRRDLVTLALCAGYAYDASAVDPNDLEFGPAAAIEVDGDPRQALMPLSVKDVPGAGYQEEQAILQNFNDVAGLTDALDNNPGGVSGDTTATEAQLVQAALGRRIELGSRRFEIEIVRHAACEFLYLDQRKIRQRTITVQNPEPEPTDPDVARWRWVKIGPGEIEGEFEIKVEGGSLAARNVPQDRADASQIMNMFGQSEFVNSIQPILYALKKMGVEHPQTWLRSPERPIPPGVLQRLEKVFGQHIVRAAVRAEAVAQDEEEAATQGQQAQEPAAVS